MINENDKSVDKMWIARDESIGLNLFFDFKPRVKGKKPYREYYNVKKGDLNEFSHRIELDEKSFPSVKFEDGPIEVELVIKK